MNNHSSENLLHSMPVGKAITKVAIPGITAMLIMAVYNFVDTLFIGMLNDDLALSAVSIAFPIMTLMSALGQVLGAGAAASIGRAFGAGREDYANKTATTIVYTSFIAGFIFMAIGLILIEPIFKLFGTTDAVMPYAIEYGKWMYIGAIFSIPNQSFNNIARAETKALLSMVTLMTGAIANIILDPIFMFDLNGFGFNMGIEGASIATTISQGISFIFIASYFFRGKTRVQVKPKNFKASKEIYSDVLRSGAPVGVTQVLNTVAVSVTNIVAIAAAPTVAIGINMQSAYGVVLKVLTIFNFIVMGYLQGYQPIASYSYGAKNKERFFECLNYAKRFIIFYAIGVTIITQLIAPMLVQMFTQNAEIIEIGAKFIRFNNIFFIPTSFVFLLMLTFQATGNGKQGAILALSRQGLLYVPFLLIFSQLFGSAGIFYAQPPADFLTAVIGVFLYFQLKKQLEIHFKT